MNIKIYHKMSNEEFLEVIQSVGFKTYSNEQVTKALENTMYMVKVEVDGKLAGIGRVVGDYSIVCCLSDICVKPEFQKKGLGLIIVNELKKAISDKLIAYLEKHPDKAASLINATSQIKTALAALAIADLTIAFINGLQSPSIWLNIRQRDVKNSDRLAAGLISTIYNALTYIPYVGVVFGLVFDKGSFAKTVLQYAYELFGDEDVSNDLAIRQKRADIELDKYNKEHNTAYDWDQYSHEVLHNYNMNETLGNVWNIYYSK